MWWLGFVNWIGPLAYFTVGRKGFSALCRAGAHLSICNKARSN